MVRQPDRVQQHPGYGVATPRAGRLGFSVVGALSLALCVGLGTAGTAAADANGGGDGAADSEAAEPALDPELLKQIERARAFEESQLASERAEAEAERAAELEKLRLEQEAAAEEARLAAERAARIQAEIGQELSYQSNLMGRSKGDSPLTPADPAQNASEFLDSSYLSDADPRTADAAPLMRELPDAIFEEEETKVEANTWGNPRRLILVRQVLDADSDEAPELVRYREPSNRDLVRQVEDSDYDGRPDVWSLYEQNELRTRSLDTNRSGKADVWETYRSGWVVLKEIDRDGDGVKDASFKYENGELVSETHDANNDGNPDLVIVFEDRMRVRSEEDQDRDGRVDLWIFYRTDNGKERVDRLERDEAGRGFADVFDTFELADGEVYLARRTTDVDGDGNIDVVRIYRRGKIVRMEVADPDLL